MLRFDFTKRQLFEKKGTWVILGVSIIIFAYYISIYWFQLTLIQGDSMYPSFHDKQVVLLDRHSRMYIVGDVIVFHCKGLGTNLVKRIVAEPGDSVLIVDGMLYVSGKVSNQYSEESLFEYGGIAEHEIILGKGQFFVLGDNLSKSKDSRYSEVGIVCEKDIIGKVIVR